MSKEITANNLLKDKNNTRQVLAEEVEELYGIVDNLKKKINSYQDSITEYDKKIRQQSSALEEFYKSIDRHMNNESLLKDTINIKNKEIEELKNIIIEYAKKEVKHK